MDSTRNEGRNKHANKYEIKTEEKAACIDRLDIDCWPIDWPQPSVGAWTQWSVSTSLLMNITDELQRIAHRDVNLSWFNMFWILYCFVEILHQKTQHIYYFPCCWSCTVGLYCTAHREYWNGNVLSVVEKYRRTYLGYIEVTMASCSTLSLSCRLEQEKHVGGARPACGLN